MKVFSVVVLFVLVSVVQAQTLPAAPKPHFDRIEWSLLAADGAARGLDVYSTHLASEGGGHDAELPGWIANHPATMAGYSGGVVLLQYYIARKLFKRGRRKWAYALAALDSGQTGYAVAHNLSLPHQKTR